MRKAPVLGKTEHLSDGRMVFVGRRKGQDTLFVGFRSAEGEISRIYLNEDAGAALARLLSNPDGGSELFQPPEQTAWQVARDIRP